MWRERERVCARERARMRGGSRASGMRAGHQRARLREGNRAKGTRAGRLWGAAAGWGCP